MPTQKQKPMTFAEFQRLREWFGSEAGKNHRADPLWSNNNKKNRQACDILLDKILNQDIPDTVQEITLAVGQKVTGSHTFSHRGALKHAQNIISMLNTQYLQKACESVFPGRNERPGFFLQSKTEKPICYLLEWKPSSPPPKLALIHWPWYSSFIDGYLRGVDVAVQSVNGKILDIRLEEYELSILDSDGTRKTVVLEGEKPSEPEMRRKPLLHFAIKTARNHGYNNILICLSGDLDVSEMQQHLDQGVRLVLTGGHPMTAPENGAICIRQNDKAIGNNLGKAVLRSLNSEGPGPKQILAVTFKNPREFGQEHLRWQHFYASLSGHVTADQITIREVPYVHTQTGRDLALVARKIIHQILTEHAEFPFGHVVAMPGDFALGVDEALIGKSRNEVRIYTADLYSEILLRLCLPDEHSRIAVACGLDSFSMGKLAAEWTLNNYNPPNSLMWLEPELILDTTAKTKKIDNGTTLVRCYPKLRLESQGANKVRCQDEN